MADNAIGVLEEDRRLVRELLSELVDPSDHTATHTDVLQQLERELDVYTRIKEEIFYPALRAHVDEAEAAQHIRESEEHRAVERMVLPDLKQTEPGTPEFAGRARVLRDMVEHHARQEEEGLFAKVRAALSAEELAELGRRLEARRQELQ